MLATILEIITGILKAIPIISKWFTKSPTQKVEDLHKDIDEQIDKSKKIRNPRDL